MRWPETTDTASIRNLKITVDYPFDQVQPFQLPCVYVVGEINNGNSTAAKHALHFIAAYFRQLAVKWNECLAIAVRVRQY